MKAIVVKDQAAGTAGMKLVERPEPQGGSLASLSGRTTAMSLSDKMAIPTPDSTNIATLSIRLS